IRMTAASPELGEVSIRGCTVINNGGYGVFANEEYDNSGLRLSISDNLFSSSAAITDAHIRLGSWVGSIVQADVRDSRMRGTTKPLVITGSPNTLWIHGNQAETNEGYSIGAPVNGVFHAGNSWDAATVNRTISLASLESYLTSVAIAGAEPG